MPERNHIATIEQEQIQPMEKIENLILVIRGKQVMLDRDLAWLYGVDTKRLNEQVKRNIERFPIHFRFQLTENETTELVANCDRLQALKHSSVFPYAFTEQGVAMLSTVLRSETAVNVSIHIMDAFTAMRHFIASNAQVFQRLEVAATHHGYCLYRLRMGRHGPRCHRRCQSVRGRLALDARTRPRGHIVANARH